MKAKESAPNIHDNDERQCEMNLRNKAIVFLPVILICTLCGCNNSITKPHHKIAFKDMNHKLSPSEVAHVLVNDLIAGFRVVPLAIAHGNEIIDHLRSETENFDLLNSRNAFWLAEVFAANETPEGRTLLFELLQNNNIYAKLIGAVGLAGQGMLDEDSRQFLVKLANETEDHASVQLAILALGKDGNKASLPVILQHLKRRPGYYHTHKQACQALASIGHTEAVLPLREAMQDEMFHALYHAFFALVELGDSDVAVELAIRRVDAQFRGYPSGDIVRALEEYTGKKYGFNQKRWKKWLEAEGH